jgi:hypothetical protein
MVDPIDTEPAVPATPETAPLPPAQAALRDRLIARVKPFVPWFSLALGLTSAFVMERKPDKCGRVALAALAVWVLILVQRWLARVPEPERRWVARAVLAARRSTLMATQSLLQLKLFFALPFYFKAADFGEPAHVAFLFGLVVLSAASLWDPLTERWLARRYVAALLPATASFVALTAVLPGLGLSTRASLWIAAAVGSGGAALMGIAHAAPSDRMRAVPQALLVTAALPALLALGGSRFVPAAPLRLAKIEFGRQVRDHWITQPLKNGSPAPARLFCATAIASPLGVRDQLVHVWRKDGVVLARKPLEVIGGRGAGYRTQSRIAVGPRESGRFRCTVETASGQVLGSKNISLRARDVEASPGR